ncbi:MAG: D-alanyl-D-alanine carboxypeptidase/D-alanyl-D-alanine-endopeptidase [Phycisphaeraceae bacterium]|nr:D-alanyl-D-alanine carboxypeptidase/D-alanyl-D-alanine-endopeptidase [Phycisphaeraceae bacterium]
MTPVPNSAPGHSGELLSTDGGVMRQREITRRFVLVLAVLVAIAPLLTPAASAQVLNRQLRDALESAKLGSAKVGISIVETSDGKPLGALRDNAGPADLFIPASNMKLMTSGAAVLVLGADYEFRTRVYKSGDRLVIEGAGDPAFGDAELLGRSQMGVDDFINRLVKAVLDARTPSGEMLNATFSEVIADDRVFDREYVHPSWPADQRSEWYCAEVSGLVLNTNVLQIWASPGRDERDAPSLRWEPNGGGIEVENRARTVRRDDAGASIAFIRNPSTNRFVARGSIRRAFDEPVRVCMHESDGALASIIAERLTLAGRGTGGRPITGRLAHLDESLGEPGQVLVVVKTPMQTVLERCNGDSHNLYAECLLKKTGNAVSGQPGSWANGAAVLRMQLRELVGPTAAAQVQVADGSGLSRGNQITPEMMTSWLAALQRDRRAGDAFVNSIPLAGVEGNMVRRFKGKALKNEVRCKSGYINGVRTLSGYVTQPESGRRVAFSILVNEIPGNVSGARVKAFHEDVVLIIDSWLGSGTTPSNRTAMEREAVGG